MTPIVRMKWAKSLSWTITDQDGDKWNPALYIGSVGHGELKAYTIIFGPIHLMIGI